MSREEELREIVRMYEENKLEIQVMDEGEGMHWALNKALADGMELKPWDELDEQQQAALVLHVDDMSSWRGEGRVDPMLADDLFEHYPEFHEMLVESGSSTPSSQA